MTTTLRALGQSNGLSKALQTNTLLIYRLCLLGIVFLGVAQSLVYFKFSLSIDEPFTANLIQMSWTQMFEALRQDNAVLLHYILLKLWAQIFGASVVALRSFSLLCFVLALAIIAETLRRKFDMQTGLLAAFLLSISTPIGLLYAANARPYALLLLIIALVLWIFFRRLDSIGFQMEKRRAWLQVGMGLVVLNLLGLLTHTIYIFFACAYTAGALWLSRRAFVLCVVSNVLALAISLGVTWPILSVTLSLPTTNWMKPPGLSDLWESFLNLWGAQKSLLIFAYVGLLWVWRGRSKTLTTKYVWICLLGIGVASLLPFLASQLKPVFYAPRTPMIFLAFACIGAALVMRQLGNRWTNGIVLLALLGMSGLRSTQLAIGPDPYPTKDSITYLSTQAQCNDVLILSGLSYSEVVYYWQQLGAPNCVQYETFPQSTREHPGWIDVSSLLSHSDVLQSEAKSSVARFSRQPSARVWLFYDDRYGHEPVTNILKLQLDQQLTFWCVHDLKGSFFNSILVYSTDKSVTVSCPPSRP